MLRRRPGDVWSTRSPKPTKTKSFTTTQQTRLATRDLLAHSLKKTEGRDLTDKLADVPGYGQGAGQGRRPTSAIRTPICCSARSPSLQKQKDELEAQHVQMQTEFAIMKSRHRRSADDRSARSTTLFRGYAVSDAAIQQLQMMANAVDARRRLATRKTGSAGPIRKLAQMEAQVEQYRDEMIKQATMRDHQSQAQSRAAAAARRSIRRCCNRCELQH